MNKLINFTGPALLVMSGAVSDYSQSPSSTAEPLQDFTLVESPRPLQEALTKLENQLRVPIYFEETPLELQIAGPMRVLSVHFVPGETDALSAVQTVIGAYEQEGFAGKYSVQQHGDAIFVIPSTISRIAGTAGTSKLAISRTLITLPEDDRTIAATSTS